MGARSVWSYGFGFATALVAALILVSFTAPDARAQGPDAVAGDQAQSQSRKLAQSFYYPYYPQVRRRKRPRHRTRAVQKCAAPSSYSRGLQRCICVREGYGVSGGQCVKLAEICPKNEQRSGAGQKCQCKQGFALNGGECVGPNGDVATYGSSQTPRRRARAGELLTSDVAIVQQCLKEAGYLRAPVQTSMGRKAWTAFWFFKQDYRVGRTPKGVHDAKVQNRLFALCPKVGSQLAVLPANEGQPVQGPATGAPAPAGSLAASTQSAPPVQPEQKQASLPQSATSEATPEPEIKTPVKRNYARPEAACLPADLYGLITGVYGSRPALRKCTQACIARPANITKREADEYESKRGIRWCRSCIEIGSQLPLDDILRIERGANVQVCPRPPSRLMKWNPQAASKRPSYTKVRALYREFPKGAGNDQAIAVVIGNGTYSKGLPVNASSYASAGAIYSLLTEQLGYGRENIIDLRDATLKDMNRIFGTRDDDKGDLWRLVQGRDEARVMIYYAGHAGTKEDRSDSYLLPVDAVKYREERSGYAMSLLYANLEKLGAKSVLLLLEAGFGRDLSEFLFPPNLPEMQVRALPIQPLRGVTVITASDGDQKTLDDQKFGFGLFTRYLVEGMAGRADLAPIGNGDRTIDAVELYAYTSHMVRLAARKSFGLLQKPMLSRTGNLTVSRIQAHGQ